MYNPGDLVIIVEDCPLQYFVGKVGIVISNLGNDRSVIHPDYFYYNVSLSDGDSHIFSADHGFHGKHKILFMGKAYWVPASCVRTISMVRESAVNAPLDN